MDPITWERTEKTHYFVVQLHMPVAKDKAEEKKNHIVVVVVLILRYFS